MSTAQQAAAERSHGGPERHRAPALWLVLLAVVATTLVGAFQGARAGAGVLATTLLVAAVARLIRRGRRPEGIAVRSTTLDVAVLLFLTLAIAILAEAPGV